MNLNFFSLINESSKLLLLLYYDYSFDVIYMIFYIYLFIIL